MFPRLLGLMGKKLLRFPLAIRLFREETIPPEQYHAAVSVHIVSHFL
jgi:hypothetical protein